MRSFGPVGVLGIVCLIGSQQCQAQDQVCGGDYVCIVDGVEAAAARPDHSLAVAKLVNATGSERCPGTPIDVTAASPDERRLTCSAANAALQLLGRCKITLRRPLQVHVLNQVRHPLGGPIFGLFDTKQDKVLVTTSANVRPLVSGTPYETLPHADFYRSLIIHEVIHGIMHQNLKRPATTHAAYEYPAYALQIESLPSSVRDKFLRSFDQLAINSQSIFNDSVLFFDPFFFAARAYKHFKASADGCAHLTALLQGEVDFIAPAM